MYKRQVGTGPVTTTESGCVGGAMVGVGWPAPADWWANDIQPSCAGGTANQTFVVTTVNSTDRLALASEQTGGTWALFHYLLFVIMLVFTAVRIVTMLFRP